MAEHSLRLKATLDTQEVQQELQKLRDMQNKAVGGAGNTGTAANPQLNNLTSTLGKLNASIAALQKSIASFAAGMKLKPVSLDPSKSQYIPPISIAAGNTASALGSHVQRAIDIQVRQAVLKSIKAGDGNYIYQQMDSGFRGVFGGTRGSDAQQRSFNRQFNGMAASDFWDSRRKRLTPIGSQVFGDLSQYAEYGPKPKFLSWQAPNFMPSNSRPQQSMMKAMRFMAGSYMLGGLSQIGEGGTWAANPIAKGTGTLAGAASGGLMAGGAAAMMGLGPYGIAAAALVPVVQEISKAIGEIQAEKLSDLASALSRANKAWEEMYENFQSWDFSKFKDRIAGLDMSNLESERAAARATYESEKADYDKFNEGWVGKMRKLDSDYFSGRISATEYGNQKQDLATEQDSYKEAMEKAKEKLDAINDVYEAHKKAMEDFTNVVKAAKDFDKKLNEFDAEETVKDVLKGNNPDEIKKLIPGIQAKITAEQEKMAPIRSAGGLEAWEKQTNKYREQLLRAVPGSAEADSLQALIKSRDEAATAYKESAAEMMKAVGKSRNLEDAVDQLIKQMAELQKNADSQKAELARNQESAKNQYDQKWGRWKNEDLDKSAQKYQEQANQFKKAYQDALGKVSTAKTPEEQQTYLDEAEEAKKQWQFSQQEATSFGQTVVDRLREKLADLKTPDNTQVNSLASQGLMINKNDDEIRWKQQTDYASQQTQLQREIRDRLQQMDTASTFN